MTRAPIRIAHLGLGAFHRAHQAWYTEVANRAAAREGAEQWGIVAFTGRRPDAAAALAAADCRYDLVVRGPESDVVEPIEAIVAAHDGADAEAWRAALRTVAVLTVTITEAGYRAASDEDRADLQAGRLPASAVGRIVDGLRARREAGAGPLAIVSCDNLDGNGELLRARVAELASDDVATWIAENVSFVSSVVDRITPAVADALEVTVTDDPNAIVTEPETTWIIAGGFPAGRPAWELAGAEFVEDAAPYERRKLWLLNAAHTLLAQLGQLRGHASVSEAMGDEVCRSAVDELWADAAAVMPFSEDEIAAQCASLVARFENPRIRHALAQIANDSETKLSIRVVPVIAARLERGLDAGAGQIRALAAWAVRENLTEGAVIERFGLDERVRENLASAIHEVKGMQS